MTVCDVRPEISEDMEAIRAVNRAAFDGDAEANLVDALRDNDRVALSLIAQLDGHIVGHLLLSHAEVVGDRKRYPCLALAPMAVAPNMQNRGIGTQLVARGLELARADGHAVVIVLGHPAFYPRFGFTPASARGISCPYDAPDEAFMIVGLRPAALDGISGTIEYAPEFASM